MNNLRIILGSKSETFKNIEAREKCTCSYKEEELCSDLQEKVAQMYHSTKFTWALNQSSILSNL